MCHRLDPPLPCTACPPFCCRYMEAGEGGGQELCTDQLGELQSRFNGQAARLEELRRKALPGR